MRLSLSLCVSIGITYVTLLLGQQPINDVALKGGGKERGEWLTYGLDYAETRYSPLKRIDANNVSRLAPAWTVDIGASGGGQEATPLASNGVIYGITNWSVTFAVDARTRKELWRWDPVTQKERWRGDGGGAGGGGALTTASNLVFQVRQDGRLLAYRADDGTKLLDVPSGLTGGMGPPMTFELDGAQYIAFMGNQGGGGGRGAGAGNAPAQPAQAKLVVFGLGQ